ncbi:hypothetical protein ACFFUP_03695 [Vibrio ostreicida]|uniref:Integrase n=1 Tax=Vibrio ostreicida TaxID=526588 RepID=A0ABT8BVI2_9VIBR|nr:hypothetical protein [Vibrio ostreicida]MDN3610797.1 hypothetical protein [Vibrio ostreicida]
MSTEHRPKTRFYTMRDRLIKSVNMLVIGRMPLSAKKWNLSPEGSQLQ